MYLVTARLNCAFPVEKLLSNYNRESNICYTQNQDGSYHDLTVILEKGKLKRLSGYQKEIPTQKNPRWEKPKLTIRYQHKENIS